MHRLNPYLEKKPDFARLASRFPDFAPFVTISEEGYASIDFQDAAALRALTRCLLKEDWDLDVELQEDRLSPTVPNRLDYLLHVLDLEPHLPSTSYSRPLRVLDIGTGASAIYPILLYRLRPNARITATEIDQVSFDHARRLLASNNIPPESITIRKSPSAEPIFFPLFDPRRNTATKNQGEPLKGDDEQWDLTICNPPFFGSEAEMREGQELKAQVAHAAPTAAHNELITPGGEVAFVSTMIEESIRLGDRCRWYTSLIGKYTSLQPLVDLLRRHKIDNYMLKDIRQAKTTRWILGWSHHPSRLPDNLARPDDVIPNTSFAKLLPQLNTYTHRPQPALAIQDLRRTIYTVLEGISLRTTECTFNDQKTNSTGHDEDQVDDIVLAPTINRWSRAARRQAARQVATGSNPGTFDEGERATTTGLDSMSESAGLEAKVPLDPSAVIPLFKARLRFVSPKREEEGASLALDWLEGKDRTAVEALWKFLLTKGGLISAKAEAVGDGGYGGRLGGGFDKSKFSGRGKRGGGRGGKRSSENGMVGGEEEYLARVGQKRRLG
ncbi:hypothetical protein IAU59_004227 [Kwoniella sp. CBS 9459]